MPNVTALLDSFLSCPPSVLDATGDIDEVAIAVSLIAIPIGIVIAVCGYRLCRVTFFLCGFISGMLVTYAIIRDQIDSMQLPFEGALGVAAAGGLVLGLLSLGVQVLGLFVVGMSGSFLLAAAGIGVVAHFLTIEERWHKLHSEGATLLFSSPFPSRWLPIGCIILSCLLGGLVSLLKPRYLLIIGSSLIGSAIMMLTFGYFLEARNPLRPVRFIAAAIIGTRYMQNHYGKYLFGYVPVPAPLYDATSYNSDNSQREIHDLPFENTFQPEHTELRDESTTLPVPTTPERENLSFAFLCWSDFVVLACWCLMSAFCTVFQFMCSHSKNPRKRSVNRKVKGQNCSKSPRKSNSGIPPATRSAHHRASPRNISHELQGHPAVVSNHGGPRSPDTWLCDNVANESSTVITMSSAAVVQHQVCNDGLTGTGESSSSIKWMPLKNAARNDMRMAPHSASSKSVSSKAVQNSPAAAGHLLRMRRSLGDVLSRDFIRHCVTPKVVSAPGNFHHSSTQC